MVSLREAGPGRLICLIFAAALGIRILAVWLFAGAIGGEGAEYARIAENLMSGEGYSGIATPGTQLFFPPFYPLAISALSLVTTDAEIAGRALSTVFGALVVVPVYFIATQMYGRRSALIAAAASACHPYLIELSTTVHVEATFLTLDLAAICLALWALQNSSFAVFAASGAMYGLAYLTRPEGAAHMVAAAAIISFYLWSKGLVAPGAIARRVAIMLAAFAVFAAPYIAWLSVETGQLRIEGKSPLNIESARLVQEGVQPMYARFGVDSSLRERGVWNQPNLTIIQSHSITIGELATYLARKTKSILQSASHVIGSEDKFGSPILFAFAVLGLFSRPWGPLLAAQQIQVLSVVALTLFATYFVYYTDLRFYVLMLPILCIWASAGLQRVAAWAVETGAALGLRRRSSRALGVSAATAGVVAILMLSIVSVRKDMADIRAERPIKAAGEWLRSAGTKAIRIADSSTNISFHSGGRHFWLPYCSSDTALQYFKRNDIDYVVVRSSDAPRLPYIADWTKTGIPDARAQPVYAINAGAEDSITIYKLGRERAGSELSALPS